jgi:hypothetical protein
VVFFNQWFRWDVESILFVGGALWEESVLLIVLCGFGLQLFNEFNCRVLDQRLNIFGGLFSNWLFMTTWFLTAVVQSLITEYGGNVFKTTYLDSYRFFLSVGIGFLALPFGMLLKTKFLKKTN